VLLALPCLLSESALTASCCDVASCIAERGQANAARCLVRGYQHASDISAGQRGRLSSHSTGSNHGLCAACRFAQVTFKRYEIARAIVLSSRTADDSVKTGRDMAIEDNLMSHHDHLLPHQQHCTDIRAWQNGWQPFFLASHLLPVGGRRPQPKLKKVMLMWHQSCACTSPATQQAVSIHSVVPAIAARS
jgi:hypothetical protein